MNEQNERDAASAKFKAFEAALNEARTAWGKGAAMERAIKIAFDAGYQAGQASRSQWVRCDERLPEPYQKIWVTYDDGTVDEATEQQDVVCKAKRFGVIAWMPKVEPDPYTEDANNAQRKDDAG